MPALNLPDSVYIAAFGGLIANVLPLMELRSVKPERRPDFSDFFYWLPFIILPVLGGFAAYLYERQDIELTPFLAVHVGVSSPVVFGSILRSVPNTKINPGEGA